MERVTTDCDKWETYENEGVGKRRMSSESDIRKIHIRRM